MYVCTQVLLIRFWCNARRLAFRRFLAGVPGKVDPASILDNDTSTDTANSVCDARFSEVDVNLTVRFAPHAADLTERLEDYLSLSAPIQRKGQKI